MEPLLVTKEMLDKITSDIDFFKMLNHVQSLMGA